MIGENNELLHQEYFATSCGKSYFVLPYEGMFTVEISALNEYGESQPKPKKLSKFYTFKINTICLHVLYIILVYSSSFLKVEDFLNTNKTLQCCVEDIKLSSLRNANCTIVIKEGKINQTDKFDQQKCVSIKIPETLHQQDNLFYEAYIDGDPNICYRIIYNGNKMSV